jgi:hypothetical protein
MARAKPNPGFGVVGTANDERLAFFSKKEQD